MSRRKSGSTVIKGLMDSLKFMVNCKQAQNDGTFIHVLQERNYTCLDLEKTQKLYRCLMTAHDSKYDTTRATEYVTATMSQSYLSSNEFHIDGQLDAPQIQKVRDPIFGLAQKIRLLNIVFSSEMREMVSKSQLSAGRSELDNGEIGINHSMWKKIHRLYVDGDDASDCKYKYINSPFIY